VKERKKETSYIHTERLLRKGDCKKRERERERDQKTAAKKPIRRQGNRQDTHRLLRKEIGKCELAIVPHIAA